MKIAALVPVKLNSRRLPNKNFLMLGTRPLAHYIFETLLSIEKISSVYCYTSQMQMLSLLPQAIKLLPRPSRLDQDHISGNELFDYAISKLQEYDIIVLCHPTGPYIGKSSILKGIDAVLTGKFDSAISVKKHMTYSWFEGKTLNYNPTEMKQTQDLQPVYTETSGFYVFTRDSYLVNGSRVGKTPCLIEVSNRESVDIDTPEDFVYAEHLLNFEETNANVSFDRFFVDILDRRSVAHGNIQHISFDLDGVIIDSLPTMQKAWEAVCSQFELNIPFDHFKLHVGRPFLDILSILGINASIAPGVMDCYIRMTEQYNDLTVVHQDLVDLIEQLSIGPIKVSVVTSKPRLRAQKIIQTIFDNSSDVLLITPEDLPSKRGKPCPDPLLLACCLLGCDPSETLYVGDMEVDKVAAQRAGAHFVHACWGYQVLPKLDQVWFSSCQDLCSYIKDVTATSK